jgi:hypothetical protein|uniref:integrase core domain-containing protein n=1 Tax=Salibaculum sp. TaxID=2855480 RepID=UPI0038708ECB
MGAHQVIRPCLRPSLNEPHWKQPISGPEKLALIGSLAVDLPGHPLDAQDRTLEVALLRKKCEVRRMPKSPQTNGVVERFNGRIEEVLQSHHFRSGEELLTTLHRYAWLDNQQLAQSALGNKTALQAMKDWHKFNPELFNEQPHYLPGCDNM